MGCADIKIQPDRSFTPERNLLLPFLSPTHPTLPPHMTLLPLHTRLNFRKTKMLVESDPKVPLFLSFLTLPCTYKMVMVIESFVSSKNLEERFSAVKVSQGGTEDWHSIKLTKAHNTGKYWTILVTILDNIGKYWLEKILVQDTEQRLLFTLRLRTLSIHDGDEEEEELDLVMSVRLSD